MACSYYMGQALHKIRDAKHNLVQRQSTTLADALLTFRDALEQGRAVMTRKYILFVPPTSPTQQSHPETAPGILFLPGAGVEAVAYAGPAAMLSDLGYVVCVVQSEPTRMCSIEFGYSSGYLQSLMKSVKGLSQVEKWHLVGHSLGGFTATHVASDLSIDKICHWGAAPFWQALNDVSQTDLRILVIQADNDSIVRAFGSSEAVKKFWNLLPSSSQERVIPGTHCGFASYESHSFPEETDSRAQQQAEAVRLTHEFLQGTP